MPILARSYDEMATILDNGNKSKSSFLLSHFFSHFLFLQKTSREVKASSHGRTHSRLCLQF